MSQQAFRVGAPYRRGGGELGLWIWVMIYALRDWQYGRLGVTWFSGKWCHEICIMIGILGFQCCRYWFINKAHMNQARKEKVLFMIDRLEKSIDKVK